MKGIRVFSIAVAALMVMVVFATAVMASAPAALETQGTVELTEMEFSPEMRDRSYSGLVIDDPDVASAFEAYKAGLAAPIYVVGNTSYYFYSNLYTGNWGISMFTLRGIGENCEVWTQNNMNFPAGDPRNAYTSRLTITDDQVAYAIEEFDNKIFAIESGYFGIPAPLDGTNSHITEQFGGYGYDDENYSIPTDVPGRNMIMIMNIRDDNYYDSTFPSYVVGFFSPSAKYLYDRNIIHIDCWDWENRTTGTSARPWVYESTLAHEYQHLLHDALDPAEDSWINEGCSMYSEMLCGYGIPYDYFEYYLYTPSNSLTLWGDQGDYNILADYGAVAMFTVYMSDHFGGAKFVSTLAKDKNTSIDGVNSALKKCGYSTWNFEKVFKYWKLANLIHSNYPGAGWYNYKSIDLEALAAVQILEYNSWDGVVSRSDYFGEIYSLNGYGTGMTMLSGYGVEYIQINSGLTAPGPISSLRQKLTFDGDSYATQGWTVVGGAWYSGAGDLIDNKLVGTLDLTGVDNATLEFDTYWDIEDNWDFGFVQVSADGGETWTSLWDEEGYSTDIYDPNAHPDIIANLPGLTSWYGYDAKHLTYNLTEFAGQVIDVQFRFMTDWGTYYEGWYVWNIALNGEIIDNTEDIRTFYPVAPETDFKVTLYAPMAYYRGMILPARIVDMSINDLTERGSVALYNYAKYPVLYLIVTPTEGPADYQFGVGSSTATLR